MCVFLVVKHFHGHLKTQAPSNLQVYSPLSCRVGSFQLAERKAGCGSVAHLCGQVSLVRTQ